MVFDGLQWNAALPRGVEAFVAVPGDDVGSVRRVHAAFLREYGLSATRRCRCSASSPTATAAATSSRRAEPLRCRAACGLRSRRGAGLWLTSAGGGRGRDHASRPYERVSLSA